MRPCRLCDGNSPLPQNRPGATETFRLPLRQPPDLHKVRRVFRQLKELARDGVRVIWQNLSKK
jgi:hypothetical protein